MIVAVANQKGGVGKTTTAQALLAGLAMKGYNVLGIDMDPQGNLSTGCGAKNCTETISPTIYDVLLGKIPVTDVVQHLSSPVAYDLIPSNILLSGADRKLTETGCEHRLEESIEPIAGNYQYIIIDCPPSLGILTVNSFTAASDVLIPTKAEIYASVGINQLYDSIATVKRYCNSSLKINGALFTQYKSKANISKEVRDLTEDLCSNLQIRVYNTRIREAVAIPEAQVNQMDIFSYANNKPVANDYRDFIEEFLGGTKNGI